MLNINTSNKDKVSGSDGNSSGGGKGNSSKGNLEQTTYILPTIGEIKQQARHAISRIKAFHKKRNGYLLIGLLFYMFIILLMAMLDPMLITALNLKEKWVRAAIVRAEHLAWSTTSPIRTRLVDDIYKRIQGQLIDHIAKSKGSAAYECQGVLTQPTTVDPVGGKLDTQFGLCQPEKLLDGLNGLNNQTIDYLTTFYPEYKKPLTGENEVVRQAIIYQNQNSYDYSLTSTYVGQENIDNSGAKTLKTTTGIKRQERYHWSIRADIEAKSFRNVIKPAIVYYDVMLTSSYYPSNFGGGGNTCDREYTPTSLCPEASGDPILNECINQGYTTGDGTYWPAFGGPCPDNRFGECRISGACIDHGAYVTCPLAGGGETITMKVRYIRPQVGCASLSTGKVGKVVDDSGYGFILTVRIVSIGNTYN